MADRETSTMVADLVAPLLTGSGLELARIHCGRAGRAMLVRVVLNRDISGLSPDDTTSPVKPLTLDEMAGISRSINDALDTQDLFGETPYTLEVSSPGADAPLMTYADYRRAVGRLVTTAGGPSGRVLAVTATGLVLADDKGVPQDEVSFETAGRGKVQLEFSRPGMDDELDDVDVDDEEDEA